MFSDKLLNPDWRTSEKKAIRTGMGEGLVELGAKYSDVVVLTADLAESVRVREFAETYPERFFDVGVAEQNMIGVASGLATGGFIPFAASYATFSPGRSWEQIRVSVCLSNSNVKIIGSHGGVSSGVNGPSHQATEDIAIMRTLPKMVVIVPADAIQCQAAVSASYAYNGPVYIRTTRPETPNFTKPVEFEIGKIYTYREGRDVTLAACGIQVYDCLLLADGLAKIGIEAEVLNVSTIKPLDKNTLLYSVGKTKKLVTVEDHQVDGGMGSALMECVGEFSPVPVKRIGINNRFGMSGEWEAVYKEMGLDRDNIIEVVRIFLKQGI